MFCNVCGAQLPDGTAVCNFCGSPTVNYAAQGQGMYQQQPPMMNQMPNQQMPGQMQPDPYAQMPNQMQPDPYAQMPNQMQPDPYAQAPNQMQPDPYAQMPNQMQPDPYAQMPNQMQPDPYAQMPNQMQPDPYAQMPNQMQSDPYAQVPNQMQPDPYAQVPNQAQDPYGAANTYPVAGAQSKPKAKINLLGLIGCILMLICLFLPYAQWKEEISKADGTPKKALAWNSLSGLNRERGYNKAGLPIMKMKFERTLLTEGLFALSVVAVGLLCCIIVNNLVVVVAGAEMLVITVIALINDFAKPKKGTSANAFWGMYAGYKRGIGLWVLLAASVFVIVAGILPMVLKPGNKPPKQNKMMPGNMMQNNNMYY